MPRPGTAVARLREVLAAGPGPRLRALAVAGATGAALGISRAVATAHGLPFPCLFRWITGLPCPSCGMTRAFVALGHGRLGEALALNLASPVVYALAWLGLLLAAAQLVRGRELIQPLWDRTRRAAAPALLALAAAAWGHNLWKALAGG